jgi:hypothetical protein
MGKRLGQRELGIPSWGNIMVKELTGYNDLYDVAFPISGDFRKEVR